MTIRLRVTAVGLTMAIGLLAAATVALGHTTKFSSEVSASYVDIGNPGGAVFSGTVSSSQAKCASGRTVVVFRQDFGGPVEVATTQTDEVGFWEAEVVDQPSGSYFARAVKKVLKDTVEHRHVCKRAESFPITVP